jgi:ERCC4-type nuclease
MSSTEDDIVTLIIDNRERELKEHFMTVKNVIAQNLDIGDICFQKSGENILIIERKTVNDLSASICDGRGREQKARLLGSGLNKDRIMYLIEGNISSSTTVKGGTSTLVGSLINTQFRDGIKVYKTANIKETIYFIEKLFEKFQKDLSSFWKYESNNEISVTEYSATLKTKKKDNMTPEIWFHKQLTLIPQISGKIAEVITKEYPSAKSLFLKYNSFNNITDKKNLLKDLNYETSTGKTRKIGPKISEKIFLFYN